MHLVTLCFFILFLSGGKDIHGRSHPPEDESRVSSNQKITTLQLFMSRIWRLRERVPEDPYRPEVMTNWMTGWIRFILIDKYGMDEVEVNRTMEQAEVRRWAKHSADKVRGWVANLTFNEEMEQREYLANTDTPAWRRRQPIEGLLKLSMEGDIIREMESIVDDEEKGNMEQCREISRIVNGGPFTPSLSATPRNIRELVIELWGEEYPPAPGRDVSVSNFVHQGIDWFIDSNIPEDEWNDICEEGLTLAASFIYSPHTPRITGMPGYEAFVMLLTGRINDISSSGRYTREEMDSWKEFKIDPPHGLSE